MAKEFLGNDFWLDALEGLKNWSHPYQGGNMWSAVDCYLTACRDILGLRIPEHDNYKAWETCATEAGGFRYLHQDFCIVTDYPESIKMDAQNRPHCEDGPSHRWRDGFSLWYWHGLGIPGWIIEDPKSITVAKITAESNAEIRRVMIEKMGTGEYLFQIGATIIHADISHGLPRALMRDSFGNQYLYGSDNSTGRIYAMPVAMDAMTCRQAHESICGFDETLITHQS